MHAYAPGHRHTCMLVHMDTDNVHVYAHGRRHTYMLMHMDAGVYARSCTWVQAYMHAYAHGRRLIFLLFHTSQFKNLIKCILKYHEMFYLSFAPPHLKVNEEIERGRRMKGNDGRRREEADTPAMQMLGLLPLPVFQSALYPAPMDRL